MEKVVCIICLIIFTVSLVRDKSIFSPSALCSACWLGCFLLYILIPHDLYPLSSAVCWAVIYWVISFTAGTSLVLWLIPTQKNILKNRSFNLKVRRIYFLLILLMLPGVLFVAYKQGSSMNAGSFFFNLRMANTGLAETEYSFGIFAYINSLAYIAFLIELYVYDKIAKKRVIPLALINLVLALITVAKTSFFFLILSTLTVLSFKKRIKLSGIIFGLIGIIILFIAMSALRGAESNDINNIFLVYTLGGLPALDSLLQSFTISPLWGMHTFGLFYTLKNILVGVDFSVVSNTPGYSFVPYPTNVYTVMYPFVLDFGDTGIIVFGFIYGILSAYLYRKFTNGSLSAPILYSYFVCVLILQFFGEYLATNLSYLIQLFIFTYICTIPSSTTISWKK